MHRRRLTLSLLLSLFCLALGCQKDVQEVRRRPDVSPNRAQAALHRQEPVAPRGEPVGITAPAKTPF
jgi:hypothetical protein